MKNIQIIVFIVSLFVTNSLFAEYLVKSPYLKNPEQNINYIIDEVEFWKNAKDSINGGYFSFLSDNGSIDNDSLKSVCSQSRLGYAFSKAFMVTGNLDYLKEAHIALKFLYDYGWDKTYGGWFFTTDEYGDLNVWNKWWNPNTYKWSFLQHYAMVGIGSMCDVTNGNVSWETFPEFALETNESTDSEMLQNGFDMLNNHLWDDREEYKGYYSTADLDWANPKDKGFTPTVDGVTTNALTLYLLTRDDIHKNRFLDLADNMAYRLTGSMDDSRVKFGFAESYDNDWNIKEGSTGGSVGHVLKTSWCLARAYLVEQNDDYRLAAKRLFYNMWENGGYDHVYGGPYLSYDWSTGEVEKGKDYWMIEQAITCGLINYYIAQSDSMRDDCLEMADESLDFYMNFLWDKTNGSTYSNTDTTGYVVTNATKGDVWKSGYHGVELGYYAYVYGSLFYKDTTVSLYYYFPPEDNEQNISVYPIAIYDENLKITEVSLDGVSYNDFDPDSRTLNINPGEGGVFKVTFENAGDGVAINNDNSLVLEDFHLEQNYPNPFNNSTIIKYSLSQMENVALKIYDIGGNIVHSTKLGHKQAGSHKYNFVAENLSSGIYFYQLNAGKTIKIKKMTYLK